MLRTDPSGPPQGRGRGPPTRAVATRTGPRPQTNRLLQLVDRPLARPLAPDPATDEHLTLRPNGDLLEPKLRGLRPQYQRGVEDTCDERPDDRPQDPHEDPRARATPVAGHDRRPERPGRVEAAAGDPAEGHDAEAERATDHQPGPGARRARIDGGGHDRPHQ